MAPPPPPTGTLASRAERLVMSLQFAWWFGHLTLLLCVARYFLSYVTLNYYSRWAQFSYRTAFISAVATYGIVVFKAYRARIRPGQSPKSIALTLLGDENVQYLLMSVVFLFSRQVPLALLPFSVYSIFHTATYTRTNIIPTISPPKTPPASASSPASPKPGQGNAVANSIGRFVKEYYDASMMLVAALEIALFFRLLLSAFTFSKGSWVLLGIYTVFLRARFHQSQFVQGAFAQGTARVDSQVQNQNVPPAVRQGWETVKGIGRKAVDVTDVRKYVGGAQPVQKKPQ